MAMGMVNGRKEKPELGQDLGEPSPASRQLGKEEGPSPEGRAEVR